MLSLINQPLAVSRKNTTERGLEFKLQWYFFEVHKTHTSRPFLPNTVPYLNLPTPKQCTYTVKKNTVIVLWVTTSTWRFPGFLLPPQLFYNFYRDFHYQQVRDLDEICVVLTTAFIVAQYYYYHKYHCAEDEHYNGHCNQQLQEQGSCSGPKGDVCSIDLYVGHVMTLIK